MIEKIRIGLIYKTEKVVKKEDTASAYGSGLVEVFATPAMIALMESASQQCIKSLLPKGFSTVGIHINVSHVKATPIGMKVFCKAKLIEVDERKIVFEVIASDEEGGIGSGTHTRFIIDNKEFMEKLNQKK